VYQFRVVAVGSNDDNREGENSDRFSLEHGGTDGEGGLGTGEPGPRLRVPTSVPFIVRVLPLNDTSLSVVWKVRDIQIIL